MSKEFCIDFNAPLNEQDTDCQTFGCRQKNPNICSNNMLQNVCAFAREDHICLKPSRAWKKQYQTLLESEKK